MIKKEDFVKFIDAIEKQYNYDKEYGEKLSQTLGFGDNVMYNNEILIDGIVNYLVSQFLDKEFTEAMINNFMWDYEFGKYGECKDSGQLYDKLRKVHDKFTVKEDQTHHMYNLICDIRKWFTQWMHYGSVITEDKPLGINGFIRKLSEKYNVTPNTNEKD